MAVENQLIPIPRSEWPKLRDLYEVNWPKNYTTYYTIKSYLSWFEQDPNVKHIQIYSLNGDFSDGTFIIIDRYHVLFCTLNENLDNLTTALGCLDRKKTYFLYGFVDRVMPAVKQFFVKINFPLELNKPDTTNLYYMSREKALQFEYTIPTGLILKPVTVEYAEVANDVWPHKSPDSIEFFNRQIKFNPSLGLFDEKTKEIIGWCFLTVFNTFLALQVKEIHKRKGYGMLLVKAFAKQLAENGHDICAPVIIENEVSNKMFSKCGFKIIDKLHWLGLPSQINPNYVWNDE